MRSTRYWWLAVVIALCGLTGCRSNPDKGTITGKPKVIATYSVLGDFVRNVGGDQVELTTLVGGDGDAHTFEPSPKDGVALAKADLIFENGVSQVDLPCSGVKSLWAGAIFYFAATWLSIGLCTR